MEPSASLAPFPSGWRWREPPSAAATLTTPPAMSDWERIYCQYLYSTGVEATEALAFRGLGSHSPDYRPSADLVADANLREVFCTNQEPLRRFDLAEYINRYLGNWCGQ